MSLARVSEVKRVIDALDPEGLLALGCPSDEYESEAETFASFLRGGQPVTPESVRSIWVDRFYPECLLVRNEVDVPLAEAMLRIGDAGS